MSVYCDHLNLLKVIRFILFILFIFTHLNKSALRPIQVKIYFTCRMWKGVKQTVKMISTVLNNWTALLLLSLENILAIDSSMKYQSFTKFASIFIIYLLCCIRRRSARAHIMRSVNTTITRSGRKNSVMVRNRSLEMQQPVCWRAVERKE